MDTLPFINYLFRLRWKTAIGIIIFTVILSTGLSGYAQKETSPPPSKKARSFHYSTTKYGIPIIRAILRIEERTGFGNQPVLQLQVSFHSHPAWESIIRVHNSFTSIMETGTFLPIRYMKAIDQDGLLFRKMNYIQTFVFNFPNHQVMVEQNDQEEKQWITLPTETYDPLAFIARCLLRGDLSPGQDVTISIFDGVKAKQVVFQQKTERFRSRLFGIVDTILLESTKAYLTFNDQEGAMRIWYTHDEKKIPVSIELDLPIGKFRFELDSIDR